MENRPPREVVDLRKSRRVPPEHFKSAQQKTGSFSPATLPREEINRLGEMFRQQQVAQDAVAATIPVVAPVVEDNRLTDHWQEENTPAKDSTWERIDLPSRFIPYEFSTCNVRQLDIPDFLKLNKALKFKNYSLWYDAMGATIDQDIRQFTVPDYRYLLYWHRLNSLPKTEFSFDWDSKYGNKNKYTVTNSNLKQTKLDMPVEEYQEWQAKGFACPTVKIMEFWESNKLDEDVEFLLTRAQYINPQLPSVVARTQELTAKKHGYPMIQACIDHLKKLGLDGMQDTRIFREKLNFGVEEVVKLRDPKFDPVVWIAKLNADILQLRQSNIEEFLTSASILEAERNKIQGQLDQGEKVEAEEQEVTIAFSPWSLFLPL